MRCCINSITPYQQKIYLTTLADIIQSTLLLQVPIGLLLYDHVTSEKFLNKRGLILPNLDQKYLLRQDRFGWF